MFAVCFSKIIVRTSLFGLFEFSVVVYGYVLFLLCVFDVVAVVFLLCFCVDVWCFVLCVVCCCCCVGAVVVVVVVVCVRVCVCLWVVVFVLFCVVAVCVLVWCC